MVEFLVTQNVEQVDHSRARKENKFRFDNFKMIDI